MVVLDKIESMDTADSGADEMPKKMKNKKSKEEKTKPIQSEESEPKKGRGEKTKEKKRMTSILTELEAPVPDLSDAVKKQINGQVSPRCMKMFAVCQQAIESIVVDKITEAQLESYQLLKKLDKNVFSSIGKSVSDKQKVGICHHVLQLTGSTKMLKLQDQKERPPVSTDNLTFPAIPHLQLIKLNKLKKKPENKAKFTNSVDELAKEITAVVQESKALGKAKIETFISDEDHWREESWVYITQTAGKQIEDSANINEKELRFLSLHLFLAKSLLRRMEQSIRLQTENKESKKYQKKMLQKKKRKLQSKDGDNEDEESPDEPKRKRRKV